MIRVVLADNKNTDKTDTDVPQDPQEPFASLDAVIRARRDTNTFHLTGEAAVS